MSHSTPQSCSGYPLIPQNSICACAMFSLFFFTACFQSAHAQVTIEGDSTLVNIRIVHEGKPVEGAEVRRIQPWSRFHETGDSKGVIIGRTGSRGMISLPLRMKYNRIREGANVIAMIPGKLAGFTNISIFTDPDSITVHLHPVRSVSGIVADSSGKPVQGAKVIVSNLTGDGSSEYANLNPFGGAPGYSATSDMRGRFKLDNIPAPSKIDVQASASGYAILTVRDIPPGAESVTLSLDPESRLSGRVVYENGDPVKGTAVEAIAHNDNRWGRAGNYSHTDENGRFTFEHLSAGMYAVLTFPDSASRGFVPTPIENAGVGRGKAVKDLEIRFIRGIPVEGTVFEEETGEPVPGVTVYASYPIQRHSMPSINASWGNCRTDEMGRYRLAAIPGDIQVEAHPLEGFARGFRTQRVTVEKGDSLVSAVNLSVTRGRAIRGVVRYPDGSPAVGAEISSGFFASAYADDNGEFRITGIRAKDDVTYYASTQKPRMEAFFTVRPDSEKPVEVALHAPEYVSASGIVVDADGEPVPGLPVALAGAEGLISTDGPAVATTDKEGKFTADRIPAERNLLFVVKNGLGRSTSFFSGKDTGPFRITLPRTDRWLEGTVRDKNGKPVEGITVSALEGRIVRSATDSKGRFRLEGLVREQVEIIVRGIPGNYYFNNVMTNTSHEFSIASGRHYLSGKITDTAGKPLSGALVVIGNPIDKNQPVEVETDASGWFHLSGLGRPEVRATASFPGYEEKGLTVKTDREDLVIALEEITKR